jgi:hypothetical protein
MYGTRHLSPGPLQALRDSDGPIPSRWAARLHLLHCRGCRLRAGAERRAAERAAGLLSLDAPQSDVNEAWRALMTRLPVRPPDIVPSRFRWGASGALVVAALAGFAVLASRRSRTDLVTQVYRLSAQDQHIPKGAGPRDVDFARSLAALEARGLLRRVSDVCCADRDGEGPADDGVLTVSLAGSRSPVVILYEDTQRSGHFRSGDAVLMVSRPGLSAASASRPDVSSE